MRTSFPDLTKSEPFETKIEEQGIKTSKDVYAIEIYLYADPGWSGAFGGQMTPRTTVFRTMVFNTDARLRCPHLDCQAADFWDVVAITRKAIAADEASPPPGTPDKPVANKTSRDHLAAIMVALTEYMNGSASNPRYSSSVLEMVMGRSWPDFKALSRSEREQRRREAAQAAQAGVVKLQNASEPSEIETKALEALRDVVKTIERDTATVNELRCLAHAEVVLRDADNKAKAGGSPTS